MTNQFHFVVQSDENGEMFVDYDTLLAVMPDGAVWNETEGVWETEFDHAGTYEKLSEQLTNLLKTTWSK